MPGPTGEKLRDCCASCANSKVKCPKDKPSCSRCLERGLPCVYQVTRKTGRKQRGPTRDSVSVGPPTPAVFNDPSSLAYSANDDVINDFGSFSGREIHPPGFTWTGVAGTVDGSQPGAPFEIVSAALDEFFSTPPVTSYLGGSPLMGSAASQCYATPSSTSTSHFDNPPSSDDPTTPEFLTRSTGLDRGISEALAARRSFSMPTSVLSSSTTLNVAVGDQTMLVNPIAGPQWVSSQSKQPMGDSNCVRTALQLMSHLSGRENTERLAASSSASLPSLLKDNQDAIRTIRRMLGTTQASDGYVIMLISLSISKVLSSYVAVARRICNTNLPFDDLEFMAAVTHDHRSQSSGSSSRSNSASTASELSLPSSSSWSALRSRQSSVGQISELEEASIMPQQQLLNELYGMQTLLNELANRLQGASRMDSTQLQRQQDQDSSTRDPFSLATMLRVNRELRQRLSSLSLELTERIQEYWDMTL